MQPRSNRLIPNKLNDYDDNYPFRTRSASNGKLKYHYRFTGTDEQQKVKSAVLLVKPYDSVTCAGDTLDIREEDRYLTILPSQFLYDTFVSIADDMELLNEAPASEAINKAITKALDFGDILLGVTALEARRTFRMISTVFHRLAEFFINLYKAAKRIDPLRISELMGDLWLEARYGWRPLYGDIENLAEWLADIKSRYIRSAYGGTESNDLSINRSYSGELWVGSTVTPYSVKINIHSIVRKAGFNFEHKPSSRNDDALAQLGLDLQSIASTAWDLIPYSFVVDFFINAAGYIQTLNWKEEVDHFNGYLTSLYKFSYELYIRNQNSNVAYDGVLEAKLLNYLDTSNTEVNEKPLGHPSLRLFTEFDPDHRTNIVWIDETERKKPSVSISWKGYPVSFEDDDYLISIFVKKGLLGPYRQVESLPQPVMGSIHNGEKKAFNIFMPSLKASIFNSHFVRASDFVLPEDIQRYVDSLTEDMQASRVGFPNHDKEGYAAAVANASRFISEHQLLRDTFILDQYYGFFTRRYAVDAEEYGKVPYVYVRNIIRLSENSSKADISGDGVYTRRREHDDFEYKLVPNADISWSQKTDLVFLASRFLHSLNK